MWWDANRIETAVDRQFVSSHLLPEEISRLDRSLAFGDGLTDGTYWEWIDEKAKKIFLILVDLGIPDQIFGIIDDSWDDDDLPIALDQVGRLSLTAAKDERCERKFYYRQFYYLLKPLQKGDHAIYQDMEVVPMDVIEKRPGLNTNHTVDKVTLPNEPGKVFCRRRIPLGSGPGCLSHEDFQFEINSIKSVQNDHLVSYWASYVHQDYGYVLFTPASDFTLKSFLATTPASVKNLEKTARRRLVLNWIHCLVDTLCFIHNKGLSHNNIKPSTIFMNNDNHIFYSDSTRLNAETLASSADKTSFDKESYDYAAPERWFRPSAFSGSQLGRKATLTALSASPENTTFAISRSGFDHSGPMAAMHAPNPELNPQAADVFSLGCIILELIGFLLKKQTRSFATHRGAKHKQAGRGGAVLDSSFHKNLGQLESWMTILAKEARKKDDRTFRGIAPMLHVVERMLALHPTERPSAHDVQTRMYQILRDDCGISEPHCVHQYGGWDYNVGGLKLASPTTPTDESAPFTVSKRNSVGLYHTHSGARGHGRHDSLGSRSGGRPESREYFAPDTHSVSVRDFASAFGGMRISGGGRGGEKARSPYQAAAPVFAGNAITT
jgi:serine/threonine protein kinase